MGKVTGTGGPRGAEFPENRRPQLSKTLKQNVAATKQAVESVQFGRFNEKLTGYSKRIPNPSIAGKTKTAADRSMLRWRPY